MPIGGPAVILYDAANKAMAVQDGVAIPANTSGIITLGSDGSGNARQHILLNSNPAGTEYGLVVRNVPGSAAQPVSGTVTANQGNAVAVAQAWPTKISDGTDTVGISTVSSFKALKVDVIQGGGGSVADRAAFTEGTSPFVPVGGVFNQTLGADLTEDQSGVARVTARRALHINLRDASANELGVLATPLRVDPTGTTVQPVKGSGTAGTPDAGVVSIQGVASGTVVPVSGTVTANAGSGTFNTNENRPATAACTNVTGSASSVTVLAANASRRHASILNDSNSILFLKFGATASQTSFTVKLFSGDYFEVPQPCYTGVIDGIWLAANGAARVTEVTP